MKENSKTPYYVINHKGEVLGVVTGGRGIKRYLQEQDAHAVGNGNHRIKCGDIVYFMGVKNDIHRNEIKRANSG